MIVVDILVAVILFGVAILVFELKRRKKAVSGKTKQSFKEVLAKNWLTISLHALIGVFFAFTYLAFRYFDTPWKWFGFLHTYGLLATLAMPFALAYLCKGTKQAKIVAIIMAAVLIISPITRPFFIKNPKTIKDWDFAIPFNLCNISAIVYLIAILTKNKTLKNYMITFGIFGGIINNIQIHNTFVNYFWYYRTWESYIVHALIIIIPLFMILTEQVKPSVRHTVYNAIWVVPFFLFTGFVLNPLWNTNFFFTKPIAFTEGILPKGPVLEVFGSQTYPLYMLEMLVLVAVACVLMYLLCHFLYKRVRPKFTENQQA